MEKVILLLHLCLPNVDTTECFFIEEQMKSQQMCEEKISQLNQEFMEIETFNASCERSSYDS
jgi:hypothetical protein